MRFVELERDGEWNSFLAKSENHHIYQTREMAKVMESLGFRARFFAILKGKKRIAQIALLEKRSHGMLRKKLANSWLSYSPPVLLCKKGSERKAFTELVRALQARAKKEGISWITIWSSPKWDPVEWFSALDFEPSVKENAVLELKKTSGETWHSIYKHARRDVRKGKETEAFTREAESLNEMKEFYSIYKSHHDHVGIAPYPWEYFEAFWREVIEKGMGKLLLVQLGGEIIAGLMIGTFCSEIYEFSNAVKPHTYGYFPTDLMNWKLIEWAVPKGYRVFDLSNVPVGKTTEKEEGIKRFKKKWGTLKQYHEFKWYSSGMKKRMIEGIKSIKS